MKEIKFKTLEIHQYSQNPKQWDSIKVNDTKYILIRGNTSTLASKPAVNLDETADIMITANACRPDMTKIKKVYRFPKLSLSQDKMGLVREKYGTKTTRDKTQADLWIISDQYLSTLSTYAWNLNIIQKQTAVQYFEKFKEKAITIEIYNKAIKLINTLTDNEYINLSIPSWGLSNNKKGMIDSRDYIEKHAENISQPYIMSMENYSGLLDIKANLGKIISDVAMNDITSEDSVALTFKSYKQIKTMINSNDSNDTCVAMSLMANCKIKESHTWLAFIFFDTTSSLKSYKMWNQVAFKTLRAKFTRYIHSSGGSWGTSGAHSVNTITSYLYEDDALIEEAIVILKDRMFSSVKSLMNSHGGLQYKFNREDIKLIGKKKTNTVKGDVTETLV
jgi:hypothetical protein